MEIKKIEEVPIKKNNFEPLRAILIIIAFMLVIWGIWFTLSLRQSGTDNKTTNNDINSSKSVLPTKKTPTGTSLIVTDSFYKNYVKITKTDSVKENYPEKENIEIRVMQSNLSSVDISNWTLVNGSGDEAKIGNSTPLPVGGKVNQTYPTKVKGGDILIVSSGRSPVGVSFGTNSCTGFFEQFQDFIPPLIERCPQSSYNTAYQNLERNCQEFIREIPPCTANIKPFPSGTSAMCKSYITSKINYNGCVADNKDQQGFSQTEWRIFLGRDTELWKQPKDTITLLDSEGKLVDSVKY